MPCNCDVGENVTLFKPDREKLDGFDYVRDCYNGKPFRRMRDMFAKGVPYLDCCKDCFYFRPDEEFPHYGDEGRLDSIQNLQLELSFNCPIECLACVSMEVRTNPELSPLGKAKTFPDELFYKMVDDFVRHGIDVREFFLCGRGEPLLHPRVGELLKYAKRFFPKSLFTAHTSGNVPFRPGILELDHLTVSIDGARQESYATYRVGGYIDRSLKLIADVVRHRAAPKHRFAARRFAYLWDLPDYGPAQLAKLPRRVLRYLIKRRPELPVLPIVQWKYILFEHNDSPEEIREAQEMALDLGVDEMKFVLSHTSNRSRTFTSTEQIEGDPLFHLFPQKSRVIGSTVNDDIDSVTLWNDDVHRVRVTP